MGSGAREQGVGVGTCKTLRCPISAAANSGVIPNLLELIGFRVWFRVWGLEFRV